MNMNMIIDGDFYIYAYLARIEVLGSIEEEEELGFLWRFLENQQGVLICNSNEI